MARILLGIAIFFVAVSGFFSFQTKSKIAGLRDEVSNAKTAADSHVANLKKAEEAAKAAQEELSAANTAKAAAETAANAAKTEAAKAREELTAAQAKATEQAKEVEDLKTKLAAAPATSTTEASSESTDLQAKVQELQTKLDEQTQIAKALEAKQQEAEARAATLAAESQRRASAAALPGVEGKILSVDPSWNFVVLNIGDRQGVSRNATLLVKRGQRLVARLKVTSVNPSTAIADIVPGSMPQGGFIRRGDTVIYSGS